MSKLFFQRRRQLIHYLRTGVVGLLSVTIVAINLSACAPVLMGGAMVGTATLSADRRTLGAQTEDASIELKGANRISTLFGNEVHVSVNSYNGKVLLTGEVQDQATKARVEQLIKEVENIRSVVNEIQISAFLASLSARSSDALLTTKVKSRLFGTPDIYSSSFKVVTENGVVYLMGRVSQREGKIAAAATSEVSGVQKVVKVFEYIDEDEVKKYQPSTTTSEGK